MTVFNSTPNLGKIAEYLQPLKEAGVVRGAMQFVVDKVWYEEAEEEARAEWELRRLLEEINKKGAS